MIEGALAATGLVGKTVSDWNKENFLEDKRQRQLAEYQKMSMKIEQAKLWRKDVKDVVSLTEKKMDNYLLTNTLFATTTVMLWTEGRLETGTPHWMVWIYVICMAAAFVFLLTSVFFAMHASISAQAFMVRVLTQFARLPIPTTTEVERARTYAQAYEGQRITHVLRIPFLGNRGVTNRLVRNNETLGQRLARPIHESRQNFPTDSHAVLEHTHTHHEHNETRGHAARAPNATRNPWEEDDEERPMTKDPWLKEERSRSYELDAEHHSSVARLRHVLMIREAQKYYQAFDAYARVLMALGVNQFLFALTYFCLGYMLFQHGTSWGAVSGMAIFIVTAEMLIMLEISWSTLEQLIGMLLIAVAPTACLVASVLWTVHVESWHLFLFVSYSCHGMWMLYLLHVSGSEKTISGMPLPLRFRSVMYMDVYGWMQTEKLMAMIRGDTTHELPKEDEPEEKPKPEEEEDEAPGGFLAEVADVANKLLEADDDNDFSSEEDEDDTIPTTNVSGFGTRANMQWKAEVHLKASSFMEGGGRLHTTDGTQPEREVVQDSLQWRATIPERVTQIICVVIATIWFVAAFWAAFEFPRFYKTFPSVHDRRTRSVIGVLLEEPQATLVGRQVDVAWPVDEFQPTSLSCHPSSSMVLMADQFTAYHSVLEQSGKMTGFHPLSCPIFDGAEIRDIALECHHHSCTSLLMSTGGTKLARCGGPGADELLQLPPLNPTEQLVAITGDRRVEQVQVATSAGRLIDLKPGRDEHYEAYQQVNLTHSNTSSLVALSHGAGPQADTLVALATDGVVSLVDRDADRVLGSWSLGKGSWTSVCATATQLLALKEEDGSSTVWQFPLPTAAPRRVRGVAQGKL